MVRLSQEGHGRDTLRRAPLQNKASTTVLGSHDQVTHCLCCSAFRVGSVGVLDVVHSRDGAIFAWHSSVPDSNRSIPRSRREQICTPHQYRDMRDERERRTRIRMVPYNCLDRASMSRERSYVRLCSRVPQLDSLVSTCRGLRTHISTCSEERGRGTHKEPIVVAPGEIEDGILMCLESGSRSIYPARYQYHPHSTTRGEETHRSPIGCPCPCLLN